MKIGSEHFISVLAKTNTRFTKQDLHSYDAILGTHRASIITLKVPLENLERLSRYEGFDYFKIASKASANLERAVQDVRADSVHQGLGLPQAYTGKDVLIGITDWGFDYTHPMFYDTNLQQTRILAAWDQFKKSGPPPPEYVYGTEYLGESALLSAESDTSNIYSYANPWLACSGYCRRLWSWHKVSRRCVRRQLLACYFFGRRGSCDRCL